MRRFLKIAAVVVLVALVAGVVFVYSFTRRGLAQLDGDAVVEGLAAEVTIERDELGVPRILAASAADAFRALGFLHGQERYFQMDLLRRRAAGELAELFGQVAVGTDSRVRIHRLRTRAQRGLAAASAADRAELSAYVEGVNAGLQQIGRPFEYALLRQTPAPWLPEDSLLVVYAMYLTLQDENAWRDQHRGLMRDRLPAAMVEFLLPAGSEWDAPLVGGAFETAPIPGPEQLDLRKAAAASAVPATDDGGFEEQQIAGSNNWAVSGAVSADGSAWVANDMHLPLGLPNIWYRASLEWTGDDGEPRRIAGVTLPGVLGLVAGSSEWIAWGFTNTQGDWSDLVELEFFPGDDERYRTPDSFRAIEVFEEIVRVHGDEPQTLTVEETIWGPIVATDHRGRRYAARWVAHDTGSVNLGLTRLSEARTLEQAFTAAHAAGMPAQNFVAASAAGRIGWTIAGAMPDRFGHDGRFPVSWADGTKGWRGLLASEHVPRLLDPPAGRLWTANNRTVDGEALVRMGFGGYSSGARAGQIRDGLFARESIGPQDLLAIQLDDRALFLARWKELLQSLVRQRTLKLTLPGWEELARQLEATWTGRASVDSVAYRMVRAWRRHVANRVFDPLTVPCREANEGFNYRSLARYEGPLWRLLEERPEHLLDPSYGDWDELLAAAVDDLLESYLDESTASLDRFTWGDRNRVVIAHPMSGSLPDLLARRFDLPTEALPGDSGMPRVQSPGFGASERFVVSPQNQQASLFHMPGGQSGHPFSPHYDKGHRAWAEGQPRPFLPGETRHTLVLKPAR